MGQPPQPGQLGGDPGSDDFEVEIPIVGPNGRPGDAVHRLAGRLRIGHPPYDTNWLKVHRCRPPDAGPANYI